MNEIRDYRVKPCQPFLLPATGPAVCPVKGDHLRPSYIMYFRTLSSILRHDGRRRGDTASINWLRGLLSLRQERERGRTPIIQRYWFWHWNFIEPIGCMFWPGYFDFLHTRKPVCLTGFVRFVFKKCQNYVTATQEEHLRNRKEIFSMLSTKFDNFSMASF